MITEELRIIRMLKTMIALQIFTAIALVVFVIYVYLVETQARKEFREAVLQDQQNAAEDAAEHRREVDEYRKQVDEYKKLLEGYRR